MPDGQPSDSLQEDGQGLASFLFFRSFYLFHSFCNVREGSTSSVVSDVRGREMACKCPFLPGMLCSALKGGGTSIPSTSPV